MARRKRFSGFQDFGAHIESFDALRLNRRRAYESGNFAALYDALADAATKAERTPDQTIPVPLWVLKGAVESLRTMIDQLPSRHNPKRLWSPRYRQDMIDWHRYETVWYLTIARDNYDPEHPHPKVSRAERRAWQKAQRERGSTDLVCPGVPYPWTEGKDAEDWSVFQAAARIYRSVYAGSAGEIRKSWERVTQALRRGEAWRYYPSSCVHFKGQLRSSDERQTR